MLATITSSVDFASILTALGTVGAAVIGLVLAVKGFSMIKGLAQGRAPKA